MTWLEDVESSIWYGVRWSVSASCHSTLYLYSTYKHKYPYGALGCERCPAPTRAGPLEAFPQPLSIDTSVTRSLCPASLVPLSFSHS